MAKVKFGVAGRPVENQRRFGGKIFNLVRIGNKTLMMFHAEHHRKTGGGRPE